MRIVSLLPAATEIAAALGAGPELVGISHECDHPPQVASLPRVTRSAIDASRSSAEIDRQVRERSGAGHALFALDETRLATLAPELVLTQALCDVCAVAEDDVRALAARLSPSPAVVTLGGTSLGGVFDDVRRVATALGRPEAGDRLVAALEARVRAVHERLKAAGAPRPRVAVIEWTEPLFAAGHWTPELVRRAGGEDVLARAGTHSREVNADEVRLARPDVIVVAPCGFDLARAGTELDRLRGSPAWSWARDLRWAALDGNALLSRPGPRLVDALEQLAGVLHPQLQGQGTGE